MRLVTSSANFLMLSMWYVKNNEKMNSLKIKFFQIINIIMVDKFLGGSFITYGTDIIKYSNMNQENRSDPMIEIFPRITKCTFHKYGSSGSIQSHGKFSTT